MSIDVERNRKKLILETGCMKGGKTDKAIEYAIKISKHSKYGLTVITNNINSRDGHDRIVSESGSTFPAETADATYPESILEIIYKKDAEKFQDVIIISEANFYKHKIIPVIQTLRKESRVVIVEGLDLDFRGEPFGAMGILKIMADQVTTHYPYCQILKNGVHCSNPARYTARLLRVEDVDDPHLVDFKRELEIVRGKYRFAPYYHPTILVEKKDLSKDPKIVYTVACEDCFKIPGKQETKKVYNEIKDKGGMTLELLEKRFKNVEELNQILDFLVKEKRIRLEDGTFTLMPFEYDIDSGMYIPKG